jgi:hypothetical protein
VTPLPKSIVVLALDELNVAVPVEPGSVVPTQFDVSDQVPLVLPPQAELIAKADEGIASKAATEAKALPIKREREDGGILFFMG